MVSTPTVIGALPDRVEAQLPMVPDVGEAVGVLIGAITRAWGLPAHLEELGDAGRAVADALVRHADAWSLLGLSVERDDLDVYVRLSAEVLTGVEPSLTQATREALAPATGSHHVAIEGTRALVVLQFDVR